MEMQMLRILVRAQIGDDSTGAMLALHLCSDLTHYVQQTVQKLHAMASEIRQRRNVNLGNDDYMYPPVGARVMKRQDVVILHDDVDRSPAAQCFVAVEVAGHVFHSGVRWKGKTDITRSAIEWRVALAPARY